MAAPSLSAHFASRQPSVIRLAQIEFAKRNDGTEDLNVAIGNVSLPMHPAMQERMRSLGDPGSPFAEGVVKYSATVGLAETNAAFLNIIASSGFDTDRSAQPGHRRRQPGHGTGHHRLLRPGRVRREAAAADRRRLHQLQGLRRAPGPRHRLHHRAPWATTAGSPCLSVAEIEETILEHRPGAMVVIPYDNPTGQLYDREALVDLARLCVKHGLWLISDEAYRELYYTEDEADQRVGPDRRRSARASPAGASASRPRRKVWNACGLRIGALVTDNAEFHARAVAENTAGLCSNVIGQYIFGGLADESHADLQKWYAQQRDYYRAMLQDFTTRTRDLLPGVIVSRVRTPASTRWWMCGTSPRRISTPWTSCCSAPGQEAWMWTAGRMTLLTAPMAGFYSVAPGEPNPGRTQMRIAYVETPERMKLVPELLAGLLKQYLA